MIITNEKLAELQARTRRQFEKQMEWARTRIHPMARGIDRVDHVLLI